MVTESHHSLPRIEMYSREHRRSSSHSPYHQSPHSSSMMHSPAYPSPARSDKDNYRYSVNGLGLYPYSQGYPSASSPAAVAFPPSPHPTSSWSGASPVTAAPIVDPWTSGAYDHPVYPDARTPLMWPHEDASFRSSLSSQRGDSVFSADGSEHAVPHIKLEGGSGWGSDGELAQSNTVAPSRLTRSTNNAGYEGVYGSPLSPYESDNTAGPLYSPQPLFHDQTQLSPKQRPTSSHSDTRVTASSRKSRRPRTTKEQAKYSCEVCGTKFVRMYNKNTHLARHNPNRPKDNVCSYDECEMRFERRTDLERHVNSVHLKLKVHACDLCGKRFPRKDTLAR